LMFHVKLEKILESNSREYHTTEQLIFQFFDEISYYRGTNF